MPVLNQKVRYAVPLRWLRGASAPTALDAQGFRLTTTEQINRHVAANEAALARLGPPLPDEEREGLSTNPGGEGLAALCNRGFAVAGLLSLHPELAARSGWKPEAVTELCFQRISYLGAEDDLEIFQAGYEVAPQLLGCYLGLIHQATMGHLEVAVRGKDEATQAKVLAPFRPVLGLAEQELQSDEARKGAAVRQRDERRGQVESLSGQALYERVLASLRAGEEVADEDLEAAEAFMDAREASGREAAPKKPEAVVRGSRSSERRGGGR